jgi:predicted nicotinamide N-methyase
VTLGNGLERVPIISRNVPLLSKWDLTVWELEKPTFHMERYWKEHPGAEVDPFGLVAWPGSVVAAEQLVNHQELVQNKQVLVLGAGAGIEALVTARLGAGSVLATDNHPAALKLLEYGAKFSGYDNIIKTEFIDITSNMSLPICDLIIIADVLYNDKIATHVARRCEEARRLSCPPLILISDSQRFVHHFDTQLISRLIALNQSSVQWNLYNLNSFTGSGIMVDDDQTYDIKVRFMWIGKNTSVPNPR